MRKRQEGSAMVVVMCVMIITVALSLSLLLTASVLINNAIRSNDKEQCRINAITVSNVLVEEIKGFAAYTAASDADGKTGPSSTMPDRTTNLRSKLKSVVTTEWYAYDADAGTLGQLETRGKDYFTYEMELEGLPGSTLLEMYWIDETGEQVRTLDITNDPEEAAGIFQSVVLYLKVTSTVGRESSTIVSCFQPVVQTDGEGETFAWTSWKWNYIGHEWERGVS